MEAFCYQARNRLKALTQTRLVLLSQEFQEGKFPLLLLDLAIA